MTQTHTLAISNMTCGGCAARVGRVLEAVQGLSDVRVNFAAETAQISVGESADLQSAVAALSEAGYPAPTEEIRLNVSGLSCASCVGRLTQVLQEHAGVVSVDVNLASETARVAHIPSLVEARSLAEASTAAGYEASLADGESHAAQTDARDAKQNDAWRAFVMAAVLTLPVFVIEMGGHIFPALHHLIARTIGNEVSWTLQFLLTSLVLIGPGRMFFVTGFQALRHGAPTMNTLVALGAGAAWTFSTVALWIPDVLPQGTRVVYFEAAAVIVTLILLGKWLEARAKGQTGAAIRNLLELTPPTAKRQAGNDWAEVPVDDLRVGDVILLQPGAKVPTDCDVIEGDSRVDESMMTGEPMQVAKGTGDALTGGSVNGHGSLICRVTRTGADTTLAGIIRMVREAQGARLPIQALVDRVTLWFVPAVMAVALLTVLTWLIFGPTPTLSHALVAGVAVLIIACPCAMGLATPTSIMVGTGRAAERGVLFRQGDALQSLSGVAVIAFDKTGTLTLGKPALTDFECAEGVERNEMLALLAGVEQHSEHPLAQAIMSAAAEAPITVPSAGNIEVHPGMGITGESCTARIAIGNAALMQEVGADAAVFKDRAEVLRGKGHSVFFAAQDGVAVALLAVSDPLRPDSIEAIRALKSEGVLVAMITGDATSTAQAVASELGIDHVTAEVLPGEKRAALEALRAQHGPVAFVGDGINDAPVLAAADVGIAIGTGTDVAIETADVVVMSGNVQGVRHAVELSRATLRNIRQNLVWAFGYNVLLIPVAAGVLYPALGLLLSPGLAAGAMAFSSVFVLGNALRLRSVGA